MAEMLEECSRWVNKYHCRILIAVYGIMLPAIGTGVGFFVSANAELDRLTHQTEARTISTDQALDALTAETRGKHADMMGKLSQIEVSIAILATQLEERTALAPDPDGMAVASQP